MSKKIRLFLDQMIDIDVAQSLRVEDFDVQCTVDVNMSRANDSEILKHCIVEHKTLITLDEHFGDWTLVHLKKHPGVIRLKVNPTTTKNIKSFLLPFLQSHKSKEFENRLVIVKSTGIRWIFTAKGSRKTKIHTQSGSKNKNQFVMGSFRSNTIYGKMNLTERN